VEEVDALERLCEWMAMSILYTCLHLYAHADCSFYTLYRLSPLSPIILYFPPLFSAYLYL